MTKCLSFRLKYVLPKFIHSDHTGFMQCRHVSDNIPNILDVIEIAEEENLSCIILSVDFEAGLDILSFTFLQKCLIFILDHCLKDGFKYSLKIFQAVF